MSETSTEAPPAETGPAGDRLDRVEAKVDRLAELVAKIVPGSHAEAQQRTEDRLDRPSTVEEQVKAELERARKEEADRQAADKAAADQQAERETVAQRLARLEEKPPQPPVRRATKLLGWGP